MDRIFDHARILVKMGYFVLPLYDKDKHVLPNGCKGASTDLMMIEQWTTKYPDANIGIKSENILVLDLDVNAKKDGVKDIARISGELGPLPCCLVSLTGGGGRHLFLKRPAVDVIARNGVRWKGSTTAIDIIVGNRYIVAPPSIHPETGIPYQWEGPMIPVTDLPSLPQEWIERFLPVRY